jgi:MFS family permease
MYSYIGLTVGGLLSGLISQIIRSRKKVVLVFILTTLAVVLHYIYLPYHSTLYFYMACFLLGVGTGYWAVFVTIAAEQFGTNLRSTAATTTPNFIRGTVVPITLSFKYLRGSMGILNGALIVGIVTIAIALIALRSIDETYGRDLNFLEEK